ncbi:MAG TPA: hypothetical protein VLG50_01405 [Candidatus Saccharimonadales bacterium]|nr:hypothetical protein [Candidatus Saccharimonadales bacterium]
MLVTKKYYNQRQILALISCTVAALIVGSLQTGLIIKKCGKK